VELASEYRTKIPCIPNIPRNLLLDGEILLSLFNCFRLINSLRNIAINSQEGSKKLFGVKGEILSFFSCIFLKILVFKNNNMDRVILIVLDSVGIGELPDSKDYGDEGSNTLRNIARYLNGLNLPNLEEMGLGLIDNIKGIRSDIVPKASYGKMIEKSKGKDTTTGHWELMGVISDKPFSIFPDGFPPRIIDKFRKKTGLDILGNIPASGTEIIKILGEEHIRTGKPIIYTSADSVFQIAAHEDIIPVNRLYEICEIAREILNPYKVGRVIARPFVGNPGNFRRTERRRDFSIPPPENVLDRLIENNIPVIGIGKVKEIFGNRGFTHSISVKNNTDNIKKILMAMKDYKRGLIFSNLLDFDMLYGHRNNINGYADALKEFDSWIPNIMEELTEKDLLIITADHGCDPTTPSTDHSREYVPILVYNSLLNYGICLDIRESFADVGETILQAFGLESIGIGTGFFKKIFNNENN